MDRRKALKNMGLSLGYVVATPTLVSIVQSCKSENAITWTPTFFSKEEGTVLKQLVDIILPKTDTLAASEVNVHIFIDKMVNEVLEKEQQDLLKLGMNKFVDEALKNAGKEKITTLTPEDLETVLAATLKVSKEQIKSNNENIGEHIASLSTNTIVPLSDVAARYGFASNIRDTSVWAYKTTEYVGEEVLAYLPIPGENIACGDLEELTGGKAWSI